MGRSDVASRPARVGYVGLQDLTPKSACQRAGFDGCSAPDPSRPGANSGRRRFHLQPECPLGLHPNCIREVTYMDLRRSLFGLTVLAGIILLLSEQSLAQTPKRGGTLRVSYGNEIAHLDFHTAPGYEMMWVAMNVGCGLINITPDGKFVGDAAESWQISPDALSYTFKLRKNVLFHDGTPVDAAAVKFSIERLMDPATKSGMRSFYDPVHSVEVIDRHTVQVRLKHPYAFFLHMLAAYRTGLVLYNPVATQKYSVEDRKQGKPGAVVGCGPFKLVEWVKGSHLVMDRFAKYLGPGLPY